MVSPRAPLVPVPYVAPDIREGAPDALLVRVEALTLINLPGRGLFAPADFRAEGADGQPVTTDAEGRSLVGLPTVFECLRDEALALHAEGRARPVGLH